MLQRDQWYTSTVPIYRALSIVIAIAVCFGAILLREATSPSGSGYWPAVAAAPGGGLYVADEALAQLRLVHDGAPDTTVGSLPRGLYRGLAAQGSTLVLATQNGLFLSRDGGSTWTLKVARRFTAVAIHGDQVLAGAWNDSLWRSADRGVTWSKAAVPAGDTEFESVVITDRAQLAATLLGILVSTDAGATWAAASGVGDRVTALDGFEAGDWQGNLYRSADGVAWQRSGRVPGGVWSLAGPIAGTTAGIFRDGQATGGLGGREVTRVISSPPRYYAIVARGPVYVSDLGGSWHLSSER